MPRTKLPKSVKRRERQWVFDLSKGERSHGRKCFKVAKTKVLKKLSNQTKFRSFYLARIHHEAFLARLRWATTESGIPYNDFARQLFRAISEVAKSLNDYYGYQMNQLKRPEFLDKNGLALSKDKLTQLRLLTDPTKPDITSFKENIVDDCIDWARNESNKKVRDIAMVSDLNSLVQETINMSVEDNDSESKTPSLNELITISKKDHQELMKNFNSDGNNTLLDAMFDEEPDSSSSNNNDSSNNSNNEGKS